MSGQVVGYVRVSAADQNPQRQLEVLGECNKVFTDKTSGKSRAKREVLTDLLEYIRDDDTVRITSMDRLGRDTCDLYNIIAEITERGASVEFVNENITVDKNGASPMYSLMPEPSQRLLITVRNGVFGMAEEWAHRTDHNGRYLKETLIKMPPLPPAGPHNQAIPRTDWRYDEIALMVGKIVMRAAEAESSLSTVAFWASGFEPKAFGQTGEQLTKHLKGLGETSPAIKDLAERYEAWTPLRNQLVHSTRPMDDQGRPGMETMKQNRPKKGALKDLSKEDFYTVERQDQSALVDMYYAYHSLRYDAHQAYLELLQGIPAKNLTVHTSVPKEERLPPGHMQS